MSEVSRVSKIIPGLGEWAQFGMCRWPQSALVEIAWVRFWLILQLSSCNYQCKYLLFSHLAGLCPPASDGWKCPRLWNPGLYIAVRQPEV